MPDQSAFYNSHTISKNSFLLLFSLLFFLTLPSCSSSSDNYKNLGSFPSTEWTWMENPEEHSWSTEKLHIVEQSIDSLDTATLMIVQNGQIVKSWGDLDIKYPSHSIRKSFLSALYGIQVDEGTIDIHKTMNDLNIDDNNPLSETEKQATIQMLLKSRSGIYHPALYETAAMAEQRPERYSHAPDSFWYYNNWNFNALGTIYEQETTENIHKSFYHRIALPIEMQDYTPKDGEHYTGEESRHAAYPFEMSTRDMARFGLLYLNNGQWNEQQIIPKSWVDESTISYSDAGAYGGYGYLWWISVDGKHFSGTENEQIPEGTYTGRGYRGHVLAIIPAYDLVVVHRVNTFESGPRVTYEEFGQILTKILNAYNI